MLKLFFNKESPIVYALECLGVGFVLLWGFQGSWLAWSLVHKAAAVLVAIPYLFLRTCAWHRWYPRRQEFSGRYLGIELQFKKAMVPTAYIMTITGGWLMSGGSPWLLYLAGLLLIVIAHVNIILLYFHRRDGDRTPVNEYSRRFLTHP
ncbi:MAG: hypothetical protein HYV03_07040 [Deltaproteobacteria bacterium]|nr:hypothetical protein [Deltaproteobacteria bacterium]